MHRTFDREDALLDVLTLPVAIEALSGEKTKGEIDSQYSILPFPSASGRRTSMRSGGKAFPGRMAQVYARLRSWLKQLLGLILVKVYVPRLSGLENDEL